MLLVTIVRDKLNFYSFLQVTGKLKMEVVSDMSQDITFCDNKKCKRKSCERHRSRVNWAVGRPYRSFADLENTRYCPKYYIEKERERSK